VANAWLSPESVASAKIGRESTFELVPQTPERNASRRGGSGELSDLFPPPVFPWYHLRYKSPTEEVVRVKRTKLAQQMQKALARSQSHQPSRSLAAEISDAWQPVYESSSAY